MLVVGLTGGIGSGKTAVSDAFARRGAAVIDTDLIARELVEPGQPALAEIRARFGAEILTDDGRLDRRRLRQLIFTDPRARTDLETILHPRIDAAVRERLAAVDTPYAIVVIPLLTETGRQRGYLDRVLVVDVPERLQIERVMARDAVGAAQARQALAAQAGRAERLALADDVIHNDTSLAALDRQVEALHQSYLRGAAR